MSTDRWTATEEMGYQQMRRIRDGKPYADPKMEEAFQAVQKRRSMTQPDAEMLQRQLDEPGEV